MIGGRKINKMRKMDADGNKKGLVLVAVLWIVVVLTVIVAVLGRKSMLDSKVCLARMEATRCKWASRAGIERAIAVLNEDERQTDSLIDLWSDNEIDFNDIPLERCWFTVRVIDESSKLNINTATREQLLGLPYMVEEIADAIIDWRDSDEMPSEVGVEGGYYENLPYAYLSRNGPIRTIQELLLIRDVTEDLFYGEDTNLNGRLDYNEKDGNANPPADNGDDRLDQGWAGYLTCYSSSESQNQGNQNQNNQNNQSQDNQNQNNQNNQNQDNQNNQNQNTQNQNNQNNQSQDTQNQNNQNNQSQDNQNQNNQNNQNQDNQNQNNQNGGGEAYAKVNINTASDIVIAALLGGGDEALRIAQAIIQYRDTLMYGIEDISELVNEGIVSNDDFQMIRDYITITSNFFTIRCVATADRKGPYGAKLRTEAVVDRSTSPYKILYWYQGASN